MDIDGVFVETARVYHVSYQGWNRRYFRKTLAMQRLAIRMAHGKQRWHAFFHYEEDGYWDRKEYLKRLAVRFARRFSACVQPERTTAAAPASAAGR